MKFKHILSFELRYRAKKISTYIYFGLFLLIGFMAIHRASFGSGPLKFLITVGVGNLNANAPYVLYYLITVMSHFGLLITAAYFGNAAYRDFKENTYDLYFSYPIKKFDYLSGRFSGALLSTLFVFSGVGIGAFLGTIAPFTNSEKIGSINLWAYLQPYLTGVLPNILFAGAIFFSLAVITRKFFPVYVGVIGLIISHRIGLSLLQTQNIHLASLIDGFGFIAARGFSNYWTISEKNSLFIPLEGNLLLNRALWIALGIAFLAFIYMKFQFSHVIEYRKQKLARSKKIRKRRLEIISQDIIKIEPHHLFHFKNHLKQMLRTALLEFKGLVKNIYFIVILLLGTGFVFLLCLRNVGLIRGTQTYPVTYQVLDATNVPLYLFGVVLILFCAGELVWRERNKKVQEIYDALPIPEWVPLMGKIGALLLVQVFIMLIILSSGIIVQALRGYYHFELGLYLKELFGIRLIYYCVISLFALFVQVVVNKKFLGYIIAFLFIDEIMLVLGFKHNLGRIAAIPSYVYSDMNGYGPYVKSLIFYNIYWSLFSFFLVVVSLFLWIRGNDVRVADRLKAIKARMTKPKLIAFGTSFFSCIIAASLIVYNTNVLNRFETSKQMEKMSADYEKKYKKYDETPQPQIADIKTNVDIYPYQRKVNSRGKFILENRTKSAVGEVFVQVPRDGKIKKLSLDVPHSLKESAKEHGVYIYALNKHMKSGEKIGLDFNIEVSERGFKDHVPRDTWRSTYTKLVQNGTFLYPFHIMPAIGYDPYFLFELNNNDKRKKYGLMPKARIPSIHDKKAKMNLITKDAGWINYEAVVSTSKDQIALTSGELIKEWINGDRRYFHYKTQDKILKYFSFISGKYSVKKDFWQDISIEIYYHKEHEYNVDLMVESVKKSLEYFTKNFSPYQFKHIRIVEFPRYSIYAEAFPSIIPISEGYGFIAKYDNTKVEYIFRVTAHEVGHQWWAHQVMGANVQGMFVLTEVMAQYSALMVIKNKYDQNKINQYVKHEIDRYLRGRGRETRKEVPLALTNLATWYLNYAKGFVVMNALQDYIGENNLNAAIKKYTQEVAFQEPPYTTSLEFLEYLKEATPDHLKYIITDMFETITLYENKAMKATYKPLEDGKYLVKLKFEAKKLRADELGNEKAIQTNDLITFGVFGVDGEELCLQKHWVKSDKGEMEFIVGKRPVKAGIDPYYYLIDKHTDDNVIDVDKE